MNIIHKDFECEVVFGHYTNGNTAIQLFGMKGTEYEGELIVVASVNGDKIIPNEIVGIKTWSENKGIVKSLVDGGVIKEELQFIEPTGFVAIEYYKLTDASLNKIKQLKEEDA